MNSVSSDSLLSTFFGFLLGGCLFLTITGGLLGCFAFALIQYTAGKTGVLILTGVVVALIIAMIPVVYYSVKRS